MLLCLTRTNGSSEKDCTMYVNYHSISYFTPYSSKNDELGSELFFLNGTIVHVKETPQEIFKMRHPWKEVPPHELASKKQA